MLVYTLKRFLSMMVTLFLIATITFFLMHAIPGDPFALPRETPPEVRANLESRYGLDKPIITQYFIYMRNIVRGDFGISMKYRGQTVMDKVAQGMPVSALIGFGGVLIGGAAGLILGVFAALNKRGAIDYIVIIIAIIGVSVPNFVFASLLQRWLAVNLRLFPVAGWRTASSAVLPIIAASMQNIAFYARMLRSSMLDVATQDYIDTARSKGLSESEVVRGHILRNSMLPIVTSIGPMAAGVLTGNFVIEKIYNVPGIGQSLIIAIQNTDYTMIMGLTVMFSFITIFMYFVVDVLYGIVDPRIRIAN